MMRVRKRQEDVRDFLTTILGYAIHCVRSSGRLQGVPESEQTYEVVVREPDRRKLDVGGSAMVNWATMYARATAATFITADEAGRGFRDKLRAFGDEFEEDDRAPVDPAAVAALQPIPSQRQEVQAAMPVAQQLMGKMTSMMQSKVPSNGRVA